METGFFRWLWRFNAVAIALVAVGALVLVAYALVGIAADLLRDRSALEVLALAEGDGNPAAPEALAEEVRLATPLPVAGTRLLRGALVADQSYAYGLSSKQTYANTLNFYYLDPAEGTQRWLFPAQRRLILQVKDIARRGDAAGPGDAQVRASLFLVVGDDSSGDGRLSASDRAVLLVAAPDGGDLRPLAEGVTALRDSVELGPDVEGILVDDDQGLHLLRIDLSSRTLSGRMTLQAFPPAP